MRPELHFTRAGPSCLPPGSVLQALFSAHSSQLVDEPWAVVLGSEGRSCLLLIRAPQGAQGGTEALQAGSSFNPPAVFVTTNAIPVPQAPVGPGCHRARPPSVIILRAQDTGL